MLMSEDHPGQIPPLAGELAPMAWAQESWPRWPGHWRAGPDALGMEKADPDGMGMRVIVLALMGELAPVA